MKTTVELLDVPFLAIRPSIDGLPKREIDVLPAHGLTPFNVEPAHQLPAQLRLAYGAEFLYIGCSFPAERLIARDRGYQFGDGLIVTIAETAPDESPSGRYYLLGFSHQEEARFRWASRVLWEHDCRTTLMPLGRAVEVAGAAVEGVGRLEVAIPWSLLHPYHPWLSDAIGLDVCFVKARGENDADLYSLLPPEGGEQASRKSLPARFGKPQLAGPHQVAVVAPGRMTHGETLRAAVAVCAVDAVEDRLAALLLTGEGDLIALDRLAVKTTAGLTRSTWEVKTDALAPGGYRIRWRSAQSAIDSEQGLTVLPAIAVPDIEAKLRAARGSLPEHDASTLALEANDLAARLSSLSPARTAGLERVEMERLVADLGQVEALRNPVALRRGVFRRGFRSAIDGTLQPFSAIVPSDYTGAPWPLCVALHGSGVDDLQFLWSTGPAAFPPRMLVCAPFGRGASNSFTQGNAQKDVAEAIASMCSAYAVEPDRILLMGFSMGAYGALRTYYENPGRYRGVAVFCTPPTARLDGETHPDFTQPEIVRVFRETPVFVFHGRKDNSTPFADAERMAAALREAGARVTLAVEDDAGHQWPNARTIERYLRWVDDCIRA